MLSPYIFCMVFLFFSFAGLRHKLFILKTTRESSELLRLNCALFFCFLLLFIIHGFRYLNFVGSDEHYYRMYSLANRDWLSKEMINEVIRYISLSLSEKKLFPFKYGQFYVIVMSLIWLTLIIKFFWENSFDFKLAIFLMISYGLFLSSMNIIRQSVAAVIAINSYKYFMRHDKLKFMISLIIAYEFHASALLMLPLCFIAKQKNFMIIYTLLVIAYFLLADKIVEMSYYFLQNTHYIDYFESNIPRGTNSIRIAAYIVPAIIILFLHKNYPIDRMILNMLVLYITFCLLSLKNLYIMRINTYLEPIIICEYTKLPYYFKKESNRKFVKRGMYLCFFLFGMMQYNLPSSGQYHNILFESVNGVLQSPK